MCRLRSIISPKDARAELGKLSKREFILLASLAGNDNVKGAQGINFGWGGKFLSSLSSVQRNAYEHDVDGFFADVKKRAPASARKDIGRVKIDTLKFMATFRLEVGSVVQLADAAVLEAPGISAMIRFVSEENIDGTLRREAKYQVIVLKQTRDPTHQPKSTTHAEYRRNARVFDEERNKTKCVIYNQFDPLQQYDEQEIPVDDEDSSDDSDDEDSGDDGDDGDVIM
jgi:hypothetical protein